MARVRSGGSGYAWALVVFGAGFFICLLLAVVLWAQLGGVQEEAAEIRDQLEQVATPNELGSATIAELDSDERLSDARTVVGKLVRRIELLQSEIDALNGQVGTLQVELDAANERAQQREEPLAAAGEELEAERAANAQAQSELVERVEAMGQRIAAADQVNAQLEDRIETFTQELTQSSGQTVTQLNEQLQQAETQLAQLNREVSEQDRVIQEFREQRVTAAPPGTTLPDATIISQMPEEEKVYLNLGEDANLRLGLAFEVFDPDTLIKVEDESIQGKAIVEIIDINEQSSVARIVEQQPNTEINEGDVVANIAFDPERQFAFNVFGQFDLDNVGQTDPRDRQRVLSRIRAAGGRITEDLTYETDYLVLGVVPEFPEQPDDTTNLILMREYREALENYENYQDRIARARELNIPVLNQNRFLDLIGFYRR